MNDTRLARTRQQLKQMGLDALALVPGPNMIYLAGLSLHLSERPAVFIMRADGAMGIIAPSLEAPRVAQTLGPGVSIFAWSDETGHEGAFERACAGLGLGGAELVIEYLQMRALEVKTIEKYAPDVRMSALEEKFPHFRAIKDADEIRQTRKAVAIMETALRETMKAIKVGATEREIAAAYRIACMNAGTSTVAWTARNPRAAGSRCRTTRRHDPAPSARAASAYSARPSTTTIARTPRATGGHPTRPSTATSDTNTWAGDKTSGSTPRKASTT